MKINKNKMNGCLMMITITCLLTGAFFTGMGLQKMLDHKKLREEYTKSELEWKQALAEGEDDAIVRDLRNRELAENMKYVSLEYQIYFDHADAPGEARIVNDKQNKFSCTVSIIRDETGEVIYQSGLIAPECYIEKINLTGGLKQGFYPCTAVWDFYTQGEEYAGETAWKIVVIIKS